MKREGKSTLTNIESTGAPRAGQDRETCEQRMREAAAQLSAMCN